MSDSQQAHPAARMPETDPEILALLDFEPVVRKRVVEGAWTPELQREFIARLAVTGSPGLACEEMGKDDTGVRKLYRSPEGESFKAAWDRAIELAKGRRVKAGATKPVPPGTRPPSVDNRRKPPAPAGQRDINGRPPQPGEVINERGEWEDEAQYLQRAEEAKDSIGMKLVRSRRLYLMSICQEPVKRAAFEILTELPVDWELAARNEPQPFEPWTRTNQREPDMILTADSGWSFGEMGYGPDKKAELRKAINDYRAEQGLPPVEA